MANVMICLNNECDGIIAELIPLSHDVNAVTPETNLKIEYDEKSGKRFVVCPKCNSKNSFREKAIEGAGVQLILDTIIEN